MSQCQCNSPRCKHQPLVHLHLHTDFSALDGASKSDSYIKLAKEFNHPAITILDHGNMSGTLTHYQKCKAVGIKPILGMEAYLNDDIKARPSKEDAENIDNSRSNTHQSIIIKDKFGYENLNKLTYLSFTEGYYYKGRITTDWLFENKKGLIVTTSCMASKFARLIEEGKEAEAEERIKRFHQEFGDDFYAELQFNEIPQQKIYNKFILKMIKKYDIQPILTGDVHYAAPEDNQLQDILIAINQRKPVGQAFALNARQLSYASYDDFHRLNKEFGFEYPEHYVDLCLENTLKVAEKCTFEFETDVEKFPKYEPTTEIIDYFKTNDTKTIITNLAHAKLKQKLNKYKKNGIVKITPEVEQTYIDRLNYELKVIDDKKMLDYFMVVWELIKFCEVNDIEIGPGRGSAAGCLLSYCLGIVKIDPIRFDLYFERFLNPARKGMPDIDLDFESGTDEKTLNFLYEKYGKDRVIPVITFGTFNEKGCLKDVVKAFGYDAGFTSDVFAVTKEMPSTPTWDISLKEWFETWPTNPDCSERVRSWLTDPKNTDILKNTLKLQGQVRNIGKHAAGIVITPGKVWESIPVNICKGQIVSAFQESGGVKDLSSIGLLKLDRLKLETLNIIKSALKYIKEKYGEEKYLEVKDKVDYVDIFDLNLFTELRTGNNQGIFQFESAGMNALIKGIKVENFEELAAANSLYRPATMKIGAHDEYIKNKFNPESSKYVHSSLKPLLQNTNGVLIYQEQLMFIAREIGGMSLGEGDNLRKAMDGSGKIIAKNLQGIQLSEQEENNKGYKSYKELWQKFMNGAKEKGLSDEHLKAIESWLIQYLGYSFNRSHAVSYSYIAMQTLFLKHYYPTEFYCALLNHPKSGSGADAKEKEKRWMASAIMSAMNKGIEIVPPNLKSNWEWTIIDDKKIAMGYSSINGLGEIAFKELQTNNIKNLTREDFFNQKWSKFNKKSFENALKAGIFDPWSSSREEILEWKNIKIKDVKQYDLFTGEAGFSALKSIKKFNPTPDKNKYKEFIEVCNIDLHLLEKISKLKKAFLDETGEQIESIMNFEDPTRYYYFFLEKVEQKTSEKKGTKYYSVMIGDGFSTKRVNMWANMYDKLSKLLEPGQFYVTKFIHEKGFLGFNASAQFRRIL